MLIGKRSFTYVFNSNNDKDLTLWQNICLIFTRSFTNVLNKIELSKFPLCLEGYGLYYLLINA